MSFDSILVKPVILNIFLKILEMDSSVHFRWTSNIQLYFSERKGGGRDLKSTRILKLKDSHTLKPILSSSKDFLA